jgi:hypothetical protein
MGVGFFDCQTLGHIGRRGRLRNQIPAIFLIIIEKEKEIKHCRVIHISIRSTF